MIMLMAVMIVVVAFIVYVERSERRIPVQYAKRVVGRKVMGGQSTHLPLRVNAGGVMPVIFASSILTMPQTVGYGLQRQPLLRAFDSRAGLGRAALHRALRRGHHFLRLLLRIDCLQPQRGCGQHAEVWRVYSGHPAGQAHRGHINEILTRITLVGALYLIMISFIPEWMIAGIHLNHLPGGWEAIL